VQVDERRAYLAVLLPFRTRLLLAGWPVAAGVLLAVGVVVPFKGWDAGWLGGGLCLSVMITAPSATVSVVLGLRAARSRHPGLVFLMPLVGLLVALAGIAFFYGLGAIADELLMLPVDLPFASDEVIMVGGAGVALGFAFVMIWVFGRR